MSAAAKSGGICAAALYSLDPTPAGYLRAGYTGSNRETLALIDGTWLTCRGGGGGSGEAGTSLLCEVKNAREISPSKA